jgi:hypothetical protein
VDDVDAWGTHTSMHKYDAASKATKKWDFYNIKKVKGV